MFSQARMTQGDLEELLGHVPTYTSPVEEHSSSGLPHLAHDSEHAYHLIVMCAVFFASYALTLFMFHVPQCRTRVP